MNPLADALVAPLEGKSDPILLVPGGATLSGDWLFNLSGQIANALVSNGVQPGDRVAVQAEKSPTSFALYLACLRAGALFLPLNTAYTPAELDYFLGDAGAKVAVCDPSSISALKPIADKHGTSLFTLDGNGNGSLADHANGQQTTFETVARDIDDISVILYTSGTTGRSKGAMLSHGNLLSNAKSLAEAWRFTSNDTLLHALPIFHAHGLFVAANISLLVGAKMIFMSKFDLETVLAELPNANTMMGVPTFYTRLLSDPRFDRDLAKHMRLFISGSAPLLSETHVAFEERTGHRILERYGMTETSMNTSNPYDGERRAGTVGFPLPGVSARVVDAETGDELDRNETGILEVKGPNVFKGYWNMPDKTAEEFREDGFFITGDMAKIDDDGYVTIVGRAKDLVISGGYNVYPKEVETEIDAIDGVLESAVVGAPHPDFGEAVVAAVVLEKSAEISEANINAFLVERLARYKQPKRIFFLDALPRNTMGKVQKNQLRDRFAKLFVGD